MPLMCGPGAIATVLGMTSLIRNSQLALASFLAIALAIVATMLVTYLCLAYAKTLLGRIGPMGIDAVTRIVGFSSPPSAGASFSMTSWNLSGNPECRAPNVRTRRPRHQPRRDFLAKHFQFEP
jgi:hypothetical protein